MVSLTLFQMYRNHVHIGQQPEQPEQQWRIALAHAWMRQTRGYQSQPCAVPCGWWPIWIKAEKSTRIWSNRVSRDLLGLRYQHLLFYPGIIHDLAQPFWRNFFFFSHKLSSAQATQLPGRHNSASLSHWLRLVPLYTFSPSTTQLYVRYGLV